MLLLFVLIPVCYIVPVKPASELQIGTGSGGPVDSFLPWVSALSVMATVKVDTSSEAHQRPAQRLQHLLLSLVTVLLPSVRDSFRGTLPVDWLAVMSNLYVLSPVYVCEQRF